MGEQVNQNNAYFEQQVRSMYSLLSEESIVQRISDCSLVVDRIESDAIWQMIIRDAQQWVSRLDANWQDIFDSEKLNSARVLKFAYKHIAELPAKYKQDLENAKAELSRRRNTDTKIIKDYDSETNLEG